MKKNILLAVLIISTLLVACKKETEEFKTPAISDYAPYQTGKYIIYQLDSFRYPAFSTIGITITYQVKYQVDSLITDNLGRPAYRIFRFIRKTALDPWLQDNTFKATNTGTSLEFNENNLKFVSLKQPISGEYSWKGNAYINTTSAYSDMPYLNDWDYIYDSIGAPLTLGGLNLENTIKVAQRDEEIGSPGFYNEINFGVEYYAKGIGLVYKRFLHSEFQPPTGGSPGYYTTDSRGLTLTMIEHN